MWYKVEASKLRLSDSWFENYKPSQFDIQSNCFKHLIEVAVKSVTSDFYIPRYLPSEGEDGGICFNSNDLPLINRNPKWWEWAARMLEPYSTRLGTDAEARICDAVLIKELIDAGLTARAAWEAVYQNCIPISSELANIWSYRKTVSIILADSKGGNSFFLLNSKNSFFVINNPYQSLQAFGLVVKEAH